MVTIGLKMSRSLAGASLELPSCSDRGGQVDLEKTWIKGTCSFDPVLVPHWPRMFATSASADGKKRRRHPQRWRRQDIPGLV